LLGQGSELKIKEKEKRGKGGGGTRSKVIVFGKRGKKENQQAGRARKKPVGKNKYDNTTFHDKGEKKKEKEEGQFHPNRYHTTRNAKKKWGEKETSIISPRGKRNFNRRVCVTPGGKKGGKGVRDHQSQTEEEKGRGKKN